MMNIKFELSVDEVNIILNALSTRPYIEVVELIEKIKSTGNNQLIKENLE